MIPEIPKKLPAGTTLEQWKQYQLDAHNHEARVNSKRILLERVLNYVEAHGIPSARQHFTAELNMEQSCDAPNAPGYYRANND